jgi:putative transcriptional regulator
VLVATAAIALVVAAIGVTALARRAASPPRALAGPVGATQDEQEPAKGMFLVARRALSDPNFSESVVLLLQYSDHGAMGLIINRRTELALSDLLPDLDLAGPSDDRVFAGGPVSRDRVVMLVRSDDELEDAQVVFQDVQVSRSRELLERLVREGGDGERFRVYVGYAGWGPGQLDVEIDRGDWHVMPGNSDVVFHRRPGGVWHRLLPRMPDQVARDRIRRAERFPG